MAWAVGTGDSTGHQTLSWTTTVVAVQVSDTAVAATVRGWPGDLAWWSPGRAPSTSVLYCADGRVYLLRAEPGTAAAMMDALVAGRQRPSPDDLILRFPLHTGDRFGGDAGERNDTFYAWVVEAAEAGPAKDSLYSIAYRTNADQTLIRFVPGIGVVHYQYSHHGTTANAEAWLTAYQPGPP